MPYTDASDANLPTNVKRESEAIRKRWVATFNNVLAGGGSEADAFAAANGGLPDRKKKAMTDKEPGRAMICLYPEPNSARALALEGVSTIDSQDVMAESPDRLHVTLAYFPHVEPEDRDTVLQEAARVAWYAAPFLRSRVEGVAVFAAGDAGVPYVALLDPRPFADLRSPLEWCPWISKKHGFIPHVTLAYMPSDSGLEIGPVNIGEILTFTHISVVFDDRERHDFRLGGGTVDHNIAYRTLGPEARKAADSAGLRSEIDSDGTNLDADESPSQLRVSRPSGEGMDEAAVSDTREKAGRRLAGSWRERLSGAISGLKELLSWAEYDDAGERSEDGMEMKAEEGFYVFKDTSGSDRWLSISSNGFKDREGEIVSTAALERAVAEADKSGDRGVLRIFHIPGTEIGDCDFQGVQGRFLIESGTFYDSELARKALEFFRSTEEPLGTSIGFVYPMTAFNDGVYSEITRIVERSVCPHWAAANPWTTFNLKEERVMDSLKASWLEQIAGPKLAQDILSRAEHATKQLEETVAFKSASAVEALTEMRKAAEASGNPEVIKAYEALVSAVVVAPENSSDTQRTPQEKTAEQVQAAPESSSGDVPAEKTPEATVTIDATQLANTLVPLLEPITQAIDAVKAAHEATAKQVTELAEWQKTIDATPRAGTAYRATSADDNVIETDAAKKMLGESNLPGNPVAPYIEDLLKGAAIS